MTDISFTPPGGARGEGVKTIAFASEVWAEAQQKESKMLPFVTTKDVDGLYKFFEGVKKQKMTEGIYGLQATPEGEQKTDRIALFTKPFTAAVQIDQGDRMDTTIDLLSAYKEEIKKAMARTIDELILNALVSTVHVAKDSSTDATSKRITADLRTEEKHKDGFVFAKNVNAAATDTKLVDFTSSDLEDVKFIFDKRETDTDIFCTYTPELRRILYKDAEFVNQENRVSTVTSGKDSRRAIEYRGINFVNTHTQRLPLIDADNVGINAVDANQTAKSKVLIMCKGLSGDDTTPADLVLTADKSAAGDRADGGLEQIETTSDQMIYCWAREALFFATRSANTFMHEGKRADLSYADQVYYRVACGATLRDVDYALGVVLGGTIKKK